MPIRKTWSAFTWARLQSVPNIAGVYELGDAKGEVVYIGSGDSEQGVKGRLYYHKNHMPKWVRHFRYFAAGVSESPIMMETHHCALFVERYGRPPRLQQRMPRGYSLECEVSSVSYP
jgi:hypothetical protein